MNSLLLFYMRLLLIIATLSFGFSTFAQTVNPTSGIVYVKPMATGDGSSWNNATTDLQAAIDAPGVQKVFVAVGTYNAPSPNGFKMKNGVEIYGGFDGIDITDLTHNRILPNQLSSSGGDGGEGSVLNGQNAGKVINNNYTSDNRLNSSAVLDGFIIMNGKSGDNGGGIYNSYASSVFNNVVVKNNAAVNNGGGVYNYNSNAEFTNSIIRNNSLSGGAGNGGGVCNWESSPKFTNVSITDNTVGSNTLNAYGGGVYNLGSTSKPIFTNVTIARNAINSPYSYGAAMYNNGSSPEMYNSIIWANVNNSSVIIGDADIYNNGEATLVLKNSITQVYSSGENLKVNQNPQFVNAAAGNYTLQAISPAINGGDNTLYAGLNANTQDLAGHVRVHNYANGGRIDMGAYEYPPTLSHTDGIIYVKSAAIGSGNGDSWANATDNLHDAIDVTGVQKVFVAIGTYAVGAHSFIMKNGVEIYGGFDPDQGIIELTHNRIMPNAANAQGSVLDGEDARPVIWNVFIPPAIPLNSTAVLDGFTITNGSYATGAGIRNVNASPTLRNLVIRDNKAGNSGAGIYNENSSPRITNTVINSNSIITASSVSVYGAGVYNTSSSAPVLTNVTLTGNVLQSPLSTGGAGVYSTGSAAPEIYNSIIWNNLKLGNPFVPGADIELSNATIILRNSITQTYNSLNAADNNKINTDPQFADATYTLSATSPAINAGNTDFYTGLDVSSKDLAGNPRLSSKAMDMGAYEFPIMLAHDGSGIIYVKPIATGNRTGDSWGNATDDLHNAIHVEDVQKVFVAVGDYPVGTTSFMMKNGVEIYGGFDGIAITDLTHSRLLPTETVTGSVLNGQSLRPVIWNSDNGLNNSAVLDGFTIANGKSLSVGGGIMNHNVSPTLRNLVVINNEATTAGGGIYNNGGGIILSNSVVKDNTAQYGGGIYNNGSASVLTHVAVTGNTATLATDGSGGGGIFNQNSTLVLTNVVIADNTTNYQGGGFRNLSGNPLFTNVTLANNTANVTGYEAMDIVAGTAQLNNSIVYGTVSGAYTSQHSLIQGYAGGTAGNLNGTVITAAQVFADPSAGNYGVLLTSPTNNAGSNALFPGLDVDTKDLAGNLRVYDFNNGGVIDIGAFESAYTPPVPIEPDGSGILYVNKNNNGGNGSGDSWFNAIQELADALEAAKNNTDIAQVWVAKGTYLPLYAPVDTDTDHNPVTDRDKTFLLVKDVRIYGGFDPDDGKIDMNTRDPELSTTILSGNLGVPGVNTDNAYHVVLSAGDAGTAELNGFTVSDGYAFGNATTLSVNSKATQRHVGAGLYLVESSPVIRQVNVSNNMSMTAGAGMYLKYSTATITNVRIFENNTMGEGGGMLNANAAPVLTNVLIDNNHAGSRGGGMLNGSVFDAHTEMILTNVTIVNNTGGGIVNNAASPIVRNSIIYGNTGFNVWNPSTATFSHSLVQGSGGSTAWDTNVGTDGGHNIDVDPMFVDADNRNYHLQPGSEAADVGDNTLFYMSSTPNLSAITTDLDGNPRISEETIDLGAYEIMLTPPVTIIPDDAGIAYVRPVATGSGSGSTWDDATADLQGAINSGATRVFVAKGNYNVPLARNGFTMRNNVEIYGGFDPDNEIKVLEDTRILPNKLPSFGGGSVLNGQNIRSVIWNEFTDSDQLDNTALLDGFTLMNGNAIDGGGIHNKYASPTLTNLVIRNNTASNRGGGLFSSEGSPVLSHLVIIENTATGDGGGIYTGRAGDLKMTNILVKGNTADNGGGIYHFDTEGTLVNVLIVGNVATGINTGSAFHGYSGTNRLVNVTIAGNTGNAFYNGAVAFLDNTILYGGTAGLGYTAQHSLIEGVTDSNNSNLDATDMTLSDIFGSDYALKNTSPAVNKGSHQLYWDVVGGGIPLPELGATEWGLDLADNPRLFGATIDLGAYELQEAPVIIIAPDTDGIVYVRPIATGTARGTDWDNATADLQGAVNSGAIKVFVAVGTHPVPSSGSFAMKDGVEIYGGFDPEHGIEDLDDERILPNHLPDFGVGGGGTILMGQNQYSVIVNNGLSNTAVLDGFSITGGKDETMGGGGIINTTASPVLRNLVIRDNIAAMDGGGIYNLDSSPKLTNVVLSGNTAMFGGAMSNWNFGSNSIPVLVNVLLHNNTALVEGGAIYNGICSPEMTNVTIFGNVAPDGSAMYNGYGSSPQIHNSIIYSHTGQSISNFDPILDMPVYSFSLVEGSGGSAAWNSAIGMDGGNNKDNDPKFTDAANGDFTLLPGSAALNAGSNALFADLDPSTQDLIGRARLVGTRIDMGAFETLYNTDLTPDGDGIMYVKEEAIGLGNGSSWDDATSDFQGAVNGTNTQMVFVAVGTYNTPVGASFVMKEGVKIYGGFDPDHGVRVLDDMRVLPNLGMGDGSVLRGQGTNPVIWNFGNGLTAEAVLDGFTITNGYRNGHGGGIYNGSVSPTLCNLLVKNNTATQNGGGIYNNISNVIISHVVVEDNTATYGGGISVAGSNVQLTDVVISGNTATSTTDFGGGGFFNDASHSILTNVVISGNTSHFRGGGVYNRSGNATFTNVKVTDNTAADQGGGIYSESGNPVFTNATIANNTAVPASSGAMHIAAGTPQINNSIVYGGIDGTHVAQYSLIEGNTDTANGNRNATGITVEKIFVDPANKNYSLRNNSPAINRGSNALFPLLDPNTKDLAGAARIYDYTDGGKIDLGAYESWFQTPVTPTNGTVYVRETAVGEGDGSDWENATDKLQEAIDSDATKVFVAIGNYDIPVTSYGFVMKNGVEIYGGFDPDNGIRVLGDQRILSNQLPSFGGAGGGSVLNGWNHDRVIYNNFTEDSPLDATAVLDGFMVIGGFIGEGSSGGGIYNIYASPTLRNLVIRDNGAFGGGNGGGLFNDNNSSPAVTNVIITENEADSGSAMYNDNGSSPVLTNVLVVDNYSSDEDYQIHIVSGHSVFNNVTVIGNVYAEQATTWYNTILFGAFDGAGYTAQYSLIEGNTDFSNGNIDPTDIDLEDVFVNPIGGDFTLKSGSMAANTGSNLLYWDIVGGGVPIDEAIWGDDLAGNVRLVGTTIDMGAYELQSQSQVINTIADIVKTYGDADFELGATASSGLEVSYSSADNNIAEAYQDAADSNKWKIKIKNAGTVKITASQTGNALYLPAADVDFNLIVNKKTITVTAEAKSKTYGEADPVLTYTVDPALVSGDSFTGSLSRVSGEHVGSYAITQGDLVLSANYTLNYVGANLIIGQKTITVTAEAKSKTYGDADPALTYTVDPALVSSDSFTGNLSRVPGEDVGSYLIGQGSLRAGDNYTIVYNGADFTISRATITDINFADGSFVYDGAAHSLAITGTLPGGTSVDYVNNGRTDVGTQTVTVYISGCTNYDDLILTAQLEVTKATLTITADVGQGKIYGAVDPILTYTASGFKGTDDKHILTGALAREPGETVGSYTIMQGTLRAGDNYTINYNEADFTISRATIADISFVDGSFVYDGTAHNLAITGILPTGTSVIYVNNGRADVGTQTVTAYISGGTNYDDLSLTAELEVTKATLTIIADAGQGKIYGDDDPILTYKATGFKGNDNASVLAGALTRVAGEQVGTYPIGQGTLSAGNNYTIVFVSADFIISKAPLTIIANAGQGKVYGNGDPTLTYQATGFRNGDNASMLTGALTRVAGENVGLYPIGLGSLSAGNNYMIVFIGADFAISKATLTITADPGQGKVYGDADPVLTYRATGFRDGDNAGILTGALTRVAGENVGIYPIRLGSLNAGNNYTIVFIGADFAISKATLTVTADPGQGKVYGDADPVLTYRATGFRSGDNASIFTGALARTAGENVGNYTITQGNLNAGANYTIVFTGANFVISKTNIMGIVFPNGSFTYDGTTKSLFIQGSLPQGTTVSYQGNAQINAGTYTVTANIVGGANYNDLTLSATLTINKAPQTITFVSPGTLTRDAGTVALDVSSSSGLPLGLTIDDEMIATLNGTSMNVLRLGTVTITATQPGNENYLPAEPVSVKISITNGGGKIPLRVHPAVSPNGDGINDFLMIEGIGQYPENKITIFDKSGKILAEIVGYNNQDRVFTGQSVHDATYYYILDVNVDNEWVRLKGFFVVRR